MADHIEGLSNKDFDILPAAKREGFKFIKVNLHPRAQGKGVGPFRFSGCIELKGWKSGIGAQAKYSFREIRGGQFSFEWSEADADFVCWLLDDTQRGPYSAIGFNRDLLAAHLGQNVFIVSDPAVYIDVKKRAEWLKNNIDRIRKEKEEKRNNLDKRNKIPSSGDNISDLDDQIRFLKSRKEQLELHMSSKDEEQLKLEKEYNDSLKKEDNIIGEQLNQQKFDTSPDLRTRQQKAADTKKANKEEAERQRIKEQRVEDPILT